MDATSPRRCPRPPSRGRPVSGWRSNGCSRRSSYGWRKELSRRSVGLEALRAESYTRRDEAPFLGLACNRLAGTAAGHANCRVRGGSNGARYQRALLGFWPSVVIKGRATRRSDVPVGPTPALPLHGLSLLRCGSTAANGIRPTPVRRYQCCRNADRCASGKGRRAPAFSAAARAAVSQGIRLAGCAEFTRAASR